MRRDRAGSAIAARDAGLRRVTRLTWQAAAAGVVAQHSSPSEAMATMAAVSLAVTLILAPGLRRAVRDQDTGSAAGRTGNMKHSERRSHERGYVRAEHRTVGTARH